MFVRERKHFVKEQVFLVECNCFVSVHKVSQQNANVFRESAKRNATLWGENAILLQENAKCLLILLRENA